MVYINERTNFYPRDRDNVRMLTGKILADEQPLTECNIDEKKFIVVMVTKPKAGATPKTSEEQRAESADNKEESTRWFQHSHFMLSNILCIILITIYIGNINL